jgi:hypothetical protein
MLLSCSTLCVFVCVCVCVCVFFFVSHIAGVIACLMFKVYLKKEDVTSFTVLTDKEGREIKA